MEKNIHFADTPICQSCGMPLTAPEQFGKNADGTTNGDYCVYCCPNGEANMTGTLDHYASFYGFGQLKIATVPVVGIVLLVVTVIMVFISTCTKFGKTVYALGSNERAAALAGINVNRTRVAVYVITGILTGLSAFLWLAMNGSVDPATLGKSNEMYAIAAVVIGGISMSGGKGKLLGVLFGAMSYTIIDKIIASLQVDALINDTIKGSILLVAVIIQLVVPMIRSRVKTKHTSEV